MLHFFCLVAPLDNPSYIGNCTLSSRIPFMTDARQENTIHFPVLCECNVSNSTLHDVVS